MVERTKEGSTFTPGPETNRVRNKWVCKAAEEQGGPHGGTPPGTRLRMFCVPQAGMGAWAFHGWCKQLPEDVEVMPIELPGRNTRARETKFTDMGELVRALCDALENYLHDMPYVLLGHSMGAWVVYEMTQELRRREWPMPLKVYVSANRAPHLTGAQHDVDPTVMHVLPADRFWQAFVKRYGANKDLQSQAIRNFLWPTLQADFQVIENYQPTNLDPLPCPLDVFAAKEDNRYRPEQIKAWERHTSSTFREMWFDGKHRYIVDQPAEVLEYLAADLPKLLD